MKRAVYSSSGNFARLPSSGKDRQIYNTVIRAIIESSLVSWVGLLSYAIATTFYLTSSNSQANYDAVSRPLQCTGKHVVC
jgi:hypothetical protein